MRVEVIQPSQIPDSWYGELCGFDIETEDEFLDSPICLASIWKYGEPVIYVIPFKAFRNGIEEDITEEELSTFKKWYKSAKIAGHHLQFDCSRIGYQWGVYPADIYMDTFLVARILQLDVQNLKDLAVRIQPKLAGTLNKFEKVMGTEPPFYYNIDNNQVVQYSGLDAYLPFVLIKGLKRQIEQNEATIKLETEMLKTSIQQNVNGLKFDYDLFEKKVEEFSAKVAEENAKLDEEVGWHVRCNATADKKKLLIDTYGCEPPILTKKGAPSMSADALKMMMENDTREEVRTKIQQILDINSNFSVYNSCKKLHEFMLDGNLHFKVEQIGYDGTARIYTKDFSVNQLSWEMREAVVAPEGKKFLFFDYKAAELFIVLVWSQCRKGIDWYTSGADLHREVMRILLGKEDLTKEERNQSKVLSFSQIYGGTAETIRKDLNCSIEYAEQLNRDYLNLFPEIGQLRAETLNFAHSNGYTTTILGRRRKLQNINAYGDDQAMAKDERRAFNTRIQGSCADLLKTACNRCLNEFSDRARVAFTVFDSFLLEVPEDMTEEEAVKIMDRMSDFTDILPELKIKYDWGFGKNWKEAHDNAG